MATFRQLSETEKNEHHNNIFSILAEHEPDSLTTDGASEITLDASELEEIRDELSAVVQDARPGTQSVEEMKKNLILRLPDTISERLSHASRLVNDGDYRNAVTGIGTPIDPGMNVESFVPVSIRPDEATAYYAGGGIPGRIIDKKAGCLTLNGIHFECADMSPADLQKLEDYADSCGFSAAYSDGITQALIFGGASVYPVIDGDNPMTYNDSMRAILERIGDKKNFIRYWTVADRWNCVFVPDYNITAQDYLFARSLFIPIGGIRVNTQRMAMVRPKKLPFWGAIQQMGWSTSDFEGWIKDFEAYQIMKMSLPIMAQQSSLMYHSIPADGLIIENGPEFAKQYFKENEKQMRDWSMLHPRAINSIGEIKILERTYSGYRDLVGESKLALCASSGVAESILFEERATGLASDNRDDVTLKQSEMIRLLFNSVAPAFANCIRLLVYSCFGANSEQAKLAGKVKIKPDNGFVLSEIDKATIGGGFSQMITSLMGAGFPPESAVKIAKSFVPSAEISDDVMQSISEGEQGGMNDDLWGMLQAGREV